MQIDYDILRAAEALQAADALLIMAGAGMGVDSGLPDFRGPEGFWRAYPAIARLGLSFEEMANPTWFQREPQLAWAFYGHRLNLYRQTAPHAGFTQLLALGRQKPGGYFVFTSNVDGHFQKAGCDPARIVECHGSLLHFQCVQPCTAEICDASSETIRVDEEVFRAREPLPQCPRCHRLARPNVLMFGDWSWVGDRTGVQQRAFHRWLEGLRPGNPRVAIVELGAGRAVPTVRHTSEAVVRQTGGKLIRINPREPEVPTGQIGLPLGAAEGIMRICEAAPIVEEVRAAVARWPHYAEPAQVMSGWRRQIQNNHRLEFPRS